MTNFGKILRQIRISRNELLYDMAKKTCVSPTMLSSYENSMRPPQFWLNKLIATYSLTVEEIKLLNETYSSYEELHFSADTEVNKSLWETVRKHVKSD